MGAAVLDIQRADRVERLQDFVNDLINNKGISQQSIAKAIGFSHSQIFVFRKEGKGSDDFLNALEGYKKEVTGDQETQESTKPVSFNGNMDFIPTRDAKYILALCKATEEVNGIGMVLGNAGTGKTHTLKEYTKISSKAVYIRADCLMRVKDILKEIGKNIGTDIDWGSEREMMLELIKALQENPRCIIIDEVEQLMPEKSIRKMEVLRTIHDKVKDYGNSIIMAGPLTVEYTIKKRTAKENYGQIDSRIDYIYKTQGLSKEEIGSILSGFGFTEKAWEYTCNMALKTTKGGIRWLTKFIMRCSDVASVRNGVIDQDTVKDAVGMMMI